MEKELALVLKYFAFFGYSPNFNDVYTFFPKKINKKQLKYTPPQYSIGRKISKIKLQNWRYRSYIKLLSLFPQIKLVGLSGSISMMNAKEDDDIDLFIITAKNRLFTGRFIALMLAQIFKLRRDRNLKPNKAQISIFSTASPQRGPRRLSQKQKSSLSQNNHKNKVCLNLFFDESDLKVPKFKQTEFVGHEVLQMKPIIVKGDVYERFLEANLWVQAIFPNSSWIISKVKSQKSMDSTPLTIVLSEAERTKIQVKSQNYFKNFKLLTLTSNFLLLTFNFIESFLKNLQLTLINRHRTTEMITSTQLWFHPDDFEKKIKKLKG